MLDCFRACHLEKLLPSTYLAGASPSGLICVLKHTNPFKRPVILFGEIIGPPMVLKERVRKDGLMAGTHFMEF